MSLGGVETEVVGRGPGRYMSHFSGYGRRVEGGNYKEDVVSIFKIYVARGAGMEVGGVEDVGRWTCC